MAECKKGGLTDEDLVQYKKVRQYTLRAPVLEFDCHTGTTSLVPLNDLPDDVDNWGNDLELTWETSLTIRIYSTTYIIARWCHMNANLWRATIELCLILFLEILILLNNPSKLNQNCASSTIWELEDWKLTLPTRENKLRRQLLSACHKLVVNEDIFE